MNNLFYFFDKRMHEHSERVCDEIYRYRNDNVEQFAAETLDDAAHEHKHDDPTYHQPDEMQSARRSLAEARVKYKIRKAEYKRKTCQNKQFCKQKRRKRTGLCRAAGSARNECEIYNAAQKIAAARAQKA